MTEAGGSREGLDCDRVTEARQGEGRLECNRGKAGERREGWTVTETG